MQKIINFIKRMFLGVFLIGLIIYCFKSFLYRNLVDYKEIGQRTLIKIENQDIKDDLDFWLETSNTASTEQIIDFAITYASEDIKYTFGKCSTNPNIVIMKDQNTNCIGYSAALHAVLTYLLEKKGLDEKVKSEHKIGQLYLLNFNVHQLFKNPAFKDHDYNVITDKTNNKRYCIDPTLRTYFGIERVNEK